MQLDLALGEYKALWLWRALPIFSGPLAMFDPANYQVSRAAHLLSKHGHTQRSADFPSTSYISL